MGLAPSQGNGWVRFQPAPSRKVGQISTGVDTQNPMKPKVFPALRLCGDRDSLKYWRRGCTRIRTVAAMVEGSGLRLAANRSTETALATRGLHAIRPGDALIMAVPGRPCSSPGRSVDRPALAAGVLATRKPMLLFRLSGWFLLRFAERRFRGLLFQEPPRRTRRLQLPWVHAVPSTGAPE